MKLAHPYVQIPLALIACGMVAVIVQNRLDDSSRKSSERGEYDAIVKRLGGDEPAIRDELSEVLLTTTATLSPHDRAKVNELTHRDPDVKTLLQIEHFRQFVTHRGEGMAYHFIDVENRNRLRIIAGDQPTPQKVLEIRKALANVAEGFATMREPPDWTLKVEGDSPPPMPFLQMLEDTPRAFSTHELPTLRPNPRVPAFSAADGELLAQLEQFFNGPNARAIFPPSKFAHLYQNGRIPAIPYMIAEYHKEIGEAVLAEKRILLPEDQADKESLEALNEVYARLEHFLSAIAGFAK